MIRISNKIEKIVYDTSVKMKYFILVRKSFIVQVIAKAL